MVRIAQYDMLPLRDQGLWWHIRQSARRWQTVAVLRWQTAAANPCTVPQPAVTERRRCSWTLNAPTRRVTHPARFRIEGCGGSMTAQAPECGVTLGRVGAMTTGADGRGVAAGTRAPLCPDIVFVPGQIGV